MIEKGINKKELRYYEYILGLVELGKKNSRKAVDLFCRVRSRLNFESEWDPDAVAFFGRPDILSGLFTLASDDALARALYESGDPDKARKTYEKITVLTIRRLADRDLYAKAFYMLGKIAEQQGG